LLLLQLTAVTVNTKVMMMMIVMMVVMAMVVTNEYKKIRILMNDKEVTK
jgi:hypothetical protein